MASASSDIGPLERTVESLSARVSALEQRHDNSSAAILGELAAVAEMTKGVFGVAPEIKPTIDPDTVVKGREPLVTLARYRHWDGGVWFGVNLIPEHAGRIRVGDAVEVLE